MQGKWPFFNFYLKTQNKQKNKECKRYTTVSKKIYIKCK